MTEEPAAEDRIDILKRGPVECNLCPILAGQIIKATVPPLTCAVHHLKHVVGYGVAGMDDTSSQCSYKLRDIKSSKQR